MSQSKRFNYEIDESFVEHFDGSLKQAFLYLTDDCQLECRQCLYKPNVKYQMGCGIIEYDTAVALMEDFYQMGARKMSFLGGEPTLYEDEGRDVIDLVTAAREIGYEYVRMDSNGLFSPTFLETDGIEALDELSFSLDGHEPAYHDWLRGEGSFEGTVANIERVVERFDDLKVHMTTCVHRKLAERTDDGEYRLHEMIEFAEELGVDQINFHVLLKHGFPMDTWTGETDIDPEEWVSMYNELREKEANGVYDIDVRLPQHFVDTETFEENAEYYGYCPVKLGERILAHPNGNLRVCSGLISSQYRTATFGDGHIQWERSQTQELHDHELDEFTPCTNQSKGMDLPEGLEPVCFSLKPQQDEIVWQEELEMEQGLSQPDSPEPEP